MVYTSNWEADSPSTRSLGSVQEKEGTLRARREEIRKFLSLGQGRRGGGRKAGDEMTGWMDKGTATGHGNPEKQARRAQGAACAAARGQIRSI